jgi:hypothetical protein
MTELLDNGYYVPRADDGSNRWGKSQVYTMVSTQDVLDGTIMTAKLTLT